MRVFVAFVTLALSVASAPAFAAPVAARVDDTSILSRQVSDALSIGSLPKLVKPFLTGVDIANQLFNGGQQSQRRQE
ncbi:hypothetical protein FA95DRAFT_1606390, partial [Auriscalpium vulgare]